MDRSLQSELDYLSTWKSPFLLPCSFACTTRFRDSAGDATANELDIAQKQLNGKLDFIGSFIPGKKIVTNWPDELDEDDFETVESFDRAYDEFSLKRFAPKPWLSGDADINVKNELLNAMKWSINNKSYELTNHDGQIVHVAFSHQRDEKQYIRRQEQQHQFMVGKFASTASKCFADDNQVALYQSEHQLEMHEDDKVAECYEGCFYDRTIAFVSNSFVLMIWVGHLRYYG